MGSIQPLLIQASELNSFDAWISPFLNVSSSFLRAKGTVLTEGITDASQFWFRKTLAYYAPSNIFDILVRLTQQGGKNTYHFGHCKMLKCTFSLLSSMRRMKRDRRTQKGYLNECFYQHIDCALIHPLLKDQRHRIS